MTDIRNGVYAGKTVTVHDTEINFNGWRGTGYLILDPDTGAGAYMIGGGLDGGATFIKDSRGLGFSFTALVPSFSWLDQVDTKLSLQMAIMANQIIALIAQVNKFFECHEEVILNFVLVIGIVVAILVVARAGAALVPVAITLAISLAAMTQTAAATPDMTKATFTKCNCPSGITNEGQCWVCTRADYEIIPKRKNIAKAAAQALGKCWSKRGKRPLNYSKSEHLLRANLWDNLASKRRLGLQPSI